MVGGRVVDEVVLALFADVVDDGRYSVVWSSREETVGAHELAADLREV